MICTVSFILKIVQVRNVSIKYKINNSFHHFNAHSNALLSLRIAFSVQQWRLVGVAYGRANTGITVLLMRRPNTEFVSVQLLNNVCLAYTSRLNLLT